MLNRGTPLWWVERRLLLRRAARTPLEALAAGLREGRGDPRQQLALCLDLGLVRRARAAADAAGALPFHHALHLAWLEGDLTRFDRLAGDPATPAALAQAPTAQQTRCLSLLAQRDAQRALAIVAAMPRRPLCAPAIAWRAGAVAATQAALRHPLWRLHADNLLLQANLADGPAAKLGLLNAYLARHGLAPLRLVDGSRPPSVANLAPARDPAPAADVAPVAVVMPAHNNAAQISASVGSLLRQTRPPAQIIVVDDASTDGTVAVVEALASKHSQVRLLRLTSNAGAYVARNAGLAVARAEFVAFQDADDFAHPQRLERALRPLLADPLIQATTSRCVRLRDDGIFGEARAWPLTRWTPISLVMRRETALQQVGGFEPVRFGADSEYTARLRLLLGEHRHCLVPEPLALFGQRAGSLTTSGAAAFDAQGRSTPRIAYQEDWTERHLDHLMTGVPLVRPLAAAPPGR